jgi:hypothetical protein
MKHQHQAIAVEQAHGLLSCHGLELTFCQCGAFRLNGCDRWVRLREAVGTPHWVVIEAALGRFRF